MLTVVTKNRLQVRLQLHLEPRRRDQMQVDRAEGLARLEEAKDILHPKPLKPDVALDRSPRRMAMQLHIPHVRQLRIDVGFVGVYVEPRRRQLPALERGHEPVLVDELPARDVDEARAGLHRAKVRRLHHHLPRIRHRQHDAVGPREQVLEPLDELGADGRLDLAARAHDVVVDDGHAKGRARLLGDARADAPEADDPQHVAGRVVRLARQLRRDVLELGQVQRARGQGGAGEAPKGAEDHVDGRVGGRLGACGGRVAVDNALLGQPLSVDPVEAGTGAGEDLAAAGQERTAAVRSSMDALSTTHISSSSQFPISPPVLQNGRYMATKSPNLFVRRASLNCALSML